MGQFDDYVGRTRSRSERIEATPVRLLAVSLDEPWVEAAEGDELPLLWHWLFFVPDEPQSELGPDGHPRRGLFLPDIKSKRRMFGGGTVDQQAPLRVGDLVELTETVTSIENKKGSFGPFWVVSVERVFTRDHRSVVTETQAIIYTEAPPSVSGPSGEPPEAPWSRTFRPDEAMLFRFSALTFNAHRIHYDHDYATKVEGYPNLVVHGPLIAILLANLARQRGVVGRRFSFRARSPAVLGHSLTLVGQPDVEGGVDLRAFRGDVLVMDAKVSP